MPSYIESLFYHKGYKCIVVFNEIGHRCGYVGISPAHPLYGYDYTDKIRSSALQENMSDEKLGNRGIIPVICWDGDWPTPDILFDVHGGITYANSSKRNYPLIQIDPLWWFGFDCAHSGDAKDWVTLEKLVPKHKWKSIYETSMRFPTVGMVRDKEYVEDQCKSLAEQLDRVKTVLVKEEE